MNQDHNFQEILQKQRTFFKTGKTKDVKFRINQLKTLKTALEKHKTKIEEALYADLHKSPFEAHATETGITIAEISHNLKNINAWVQPTFTDTPLFFFPGQSYIQHEPYGVSLIISPWNYPIKNLLGPALGSITAGNTLILKPSEISSHTSSATKAMVDEFFDPEYLTVIEGGVAETTALLQLKYDYIFFTGAPPVGKIIYEAAAKNLTPCTLELGGKSPSIIDKSANLKIAAKRLIWGKFLNAGQTCVAPDYVFVHKEIKTKFIDILKQELKKFYGENPKQSDDFGRIISEKHFERISKLMKGNIIVGGQTNANDLYIEPTVIDNVKPEDPVMQEEIFGPIMPLMDFEQVDEVINFINEREKPLALYIFAKSNKFADAIINQTSSGGVCVNETIMHMATPHLPFGGVGNSGFGSYNGWFGFDTFSHKKPIMKRSYMFDVPQKYPPFNNSKSKFIKFAIKKLL